MIKWLTLLIFCLINTQVFSSQPSWLDENSSRYLNKKYPQKKFIIGIGQGNNFRESDANAITKITEQISVSVISNFYYEQNVSNENSQETSEKNIKLKSHFDKLYALTYVARYQSGENFFTLATINRQKYTTIVLKQIASLKHKIAKKTPLFKAAYKKKNIAHAIELFSTIAQINTQIKNKYNLIEQVNPYYHIENTATEKAEKLLLLLNDNLHFTNEHKLKEIDLAHTTPFLIKSQVTFMHEPVANLKISASKNHGNTTTIIGQSYTNNQGTFTINLQNKINSTENGYISVGIIDNNFSIIKEKYLVHFLELDKAMFTSEVRFTLDDTQNQFINSRFTNSLIQSGIHISPNENSEYIIKGNITSHIYNPKAKILRATFKGSLQIFSKESAIKIPIFFSDVSKYKIRYAGLNEKQLQENSIRALSKIAKKFSQELKKGLNSLK